MADEGFVPWTRNMTEGGDALLEAEDGSGSETGVTMFHHHARMVAPSRTQRLTKFPGLFILAVAAAAVILVLARKVALDGAPPLSANFDGVVSRITAKQALKEALIDILGGTPDVATPSPTPAPTPRPTPRPTPKPKPPFANNPVNDDLHGVDLDAELADLLSPPQPQANDDEEEADKEDEDDVDEDDDDDDDDEDEATDETTGVQADPSVKAPPTCVRNAPRMEAHEKITSCCFASSSPHGDPDFCNNCFPGASAEEGSSCAASPANCMSCGGQATWCEKGGGPPSLPVLPPTPNCSGIEDNCMDTRCCKVSGLSCYTKDKYFAGCLETCTPIANKGWDCEHLQAPFTVDTEPLGYVSLFCWSVMRTDGYELKLVRAQYATGSSVFGCDGWTVLSEEETWIAQHPEKIMTDVLPQSSKREKAKLGGKGKDATTSWVNANTFLLAWDTIGKGDKYKAHDWTVKIDPDAVFLPGRLRDFMKDYGKAGEVYLTNCKMTRHSLYGAIEVLSTSAVTKYVNSAQRCADKLDYAGWGEDLFTESCFEMLNVGHIEEFCLASDGCCGKKLVKGACSHRAPCTSGEVAFHPFKDEESYFRCLKQATQ